MKVNRVVKMLEATTNTGKLASDMYILNHKEYYSEAEGKHIPISEMDFQHMVRAFVKLCEQEDMLDRSKNMGRIKDQAKFYDDVIENNDRIYKKKLKEKDDIINTWKKAYYDQTNKIGKGYVFSEIPNDTDGQEFVDKMKEYFNNTTYKMRVRGQHIKPELRGTGATYWGQSRDESTHLRIYIDTKKGE